jgi:hypothetical protein
MWLEIEDDVVGDVVVLIMSVSSMKRRKVRRECPFPVCPTLADHNNSIWSKDMVRNRFKMAATTERTMKNLER